MIVRLIVYGALAAGGFGASLHWNQDFRYEDYRDFLTLLSAVSAMVFTIMGIWIAFLYPNAISRILSPETLVAADFSESGSDSRRLEKIVGAVLLSALVMVVALLIILLKIVLSATPLYVEYRSHLKATALSALIFITCIQFEAIFHVVISNVMFINDLHSKRQSRQAEEDL